MLEIVLAALFVLHPNPSSAVQKYAEIIVEESAKVEIDPLLVVALIHREGNWNHKAKSGKGDFGLMQVRAKAHPRYRSRPQLLLDPRVNISVGVSILAYWREYHQKNCSKTKHPWWSHYQHGVRVRNNGSGMRVKRLWDQLRFKTRRTES